MISYSPLFWTGLGNITKTMMFNQTTGFYWNVYRIWATMTSSSTEENPVNWWKADQPRWKHFCFSESVQLPMSPRITNQRPENPNPVVGGGWLAIISRSNLNISCPDKGPSPFFFRWPFLSTIYSQRRTILLALELDHKLHFFAAEYDLL